MENQVIGSYIFVETITRNVYRDMLTEYVFPQVDDTELEKGLAFLNKMVSHLIKVTVYTLVLTLTFRGGG